MGARFDIAGVKVLGDERAVHGNVAEPASHGIGSVYTPPALAEWTANSVVEVPAEPLGLAGPRPGLWGR